MSCTMSRAGCWKMSLVEFVWICVEKIYVKREPDYLYKYKTEMFDMWYTVGNGVAGEKRGRGTGLAL